MPFILCLRAFECLLWARFSATTSLGAFLVKADIVTTSVGPLAGESGVRRGRVLIVDDEPLLVASLSRLLRLEHDVSSVSDGVDALTLLGGDAGFDLILCDLRMPGMSGMELYKRVRVSNPSLASRMVFFTGAMLPSDVRSFVGEDVGIELLEKPFEPKVLRALVRRFVARADARAAIV
jgi:CheY-like chemotaxis protein